jgi:hypothetical protein
MTNDSAPGRVKLGSLLADIGCQAKLSDQEFAVFEQARDKTLSSQPSTLASLEAASVAVTRLG